MKKRLQPKKFSTELQGWLSSGQAKTLQSLVAFSEENSFAFVLMLLLFVSSLPIPTAGITHVMELIALIVAIEMTIGLKTIWLPKFMQRIELGQTFQGKVIPVIIKRIQWFEKRSSPRLKWIFKAPLFNQLIGLVIMLFVVAAFVAPPFSGLDTLPSLGVVIIGLAIILDDIVFLMAGLLVGSAGLATILIFLDLVINNLKHLIS